MAAALDAAEDVSLELEEVAGAQAAGAEAVENSAEEATELDPWADSSPANGTGQGASAAVEAAAKEVSAPGRPEGLEVEAPKAEDIFMLARQQNFTIVSKLLEAYPRFWDAKDEDGHSLLHWAALVGCMEFAESFVKRGCGVDSQANNKQTPLMWAVLRGHVQTTKLLLDAKAALQHKDSLGATPLMIAIQHKQYPTLLMLMSQGSSKLSMLEDRDKNGCTSAHWAAYKGDITALKFLDYFGADFTLIDNQKMLPLHRATSASQHAVIQFLVEQRCDPSARNADDESCLDIAAKNSDQAMQAVLRQAMAARTEAGKGNNSVSPDLESGGAQADRNWAKNLQKDKGAQRIFPVFWLVCVSIATFEYIIDLRKTSYDFAPVASMLFEIGVPVSLAVFFFVALADPGKVPPKVRGNSGVEEVMRALDRGESPDVTRLCTTTWVMKGLRTKFCSSTGACIEEFDHYCVWLNCAIGKGNHRQFVLLSLVEFCTQVCHLVVNWYICTSLVPYDTFGSWIFTMGTTYPLLVLITVAHCLTAPWVLMLFLHQCRLVVMNMTTNEMMNAHRYEHFWVATSVGPGRMQKAFRNPFSKGGPVKNCLDFWWFRGRSEVNMAAPQCCSSQGCSHHHH